MAEGDLKRSYCSVPLERGATFIGWFSVFSSLIGISCAVAITVALCVWFNEIDGISDKTGVAVAVFSFAVLATSCYMLFYIALFFASFLLVTAVKTKVRGKMIPFMTLMLIGIVVSFLQILTFAPAVIFLSLITIAVNCTFIRCVHSLYIQLKLEAVMVQTIYSNTNVAYIQPYAYQTEKVPI